MDDKKDDLLQKAEAYQRRMREAHAQRLEEEVADLTRWLKREAADAERSTAAASAACASEPDVDRDGNP